jgi:hypothetical protein
MDFTKVLGKIISEFEKHKIAYGLIGGYALGLYGVTRATEDLDFLIDKQHNDFLKSLLKKNLYEIVNTTDNVIQFEHPAGILGSLDFIYAFRQPSLEMLKRVIIKKVLNNTLTLKVLIPEDLIGLKVQAFVNNPARKHRDLDDIKNLMVIAYKDLNWQLIEQHFSLFNLAGMFKELKNETKTKQ